MERDGTAPPSSQHASRPLFAFLAVATSACAYYVSVGLGDMWAFAWIAPIPILVLAFRSSGRTSMFAAFSAYFLGSLNLFTYLTKVLPVAIVVALLFVPAIVFAVAVLAARYAFFRLPPWAAAFAFPAALTSYEFLLSLFSPHGTALSLAYSQTDFLPLLQVASLTGIWGVTFVLTLVPSTIAVAWTRRTASALGPAFAISLVVLGYGVVRLEQPRQQPNVRVGLATTDQSIGAAFETENPSEALAVARAYADRISRLAARGAQVIVLPEKFVGVTPGDSAEVLKVFSDAARTAHVTVVAGLNRIAITPLRNVAVVFASDGQVLTEYEKHHLLPGPETGYEIGSSIGLFPTPGARWGVAICKDMDFPAWSREYGRRGVRILAVPAWDFVQDARLHSRMAVVRGVENGFTMARVAEQGALTFSDSYGRILAEDLSAKVPEALLVWDIAPGRGNTLYTRFGDWFGWVSIIVLTSVLAGARLQWPRRLGAQRTP